MGNTNTLDALSNHDFEFNLKAVEYTAVKRFRDFLLGDFYEMRHDLSGRTLLMKVRPLANIQKYKESIERTMKRLSLSHKNLVKIKGFVGREAQNTKPPAYKLHIYFQHLPRDLSKFIKTRRNVSVFQGAGANTLKYLSEAELSEIMTQLIDVLEYLQVNGISHGDIRPEACFRSDEGQIVICDRKLIYEEEIDLSTQKNNERHFLFSPAMLESLIKKGKRHRENKHKGDVFSLGMTLLECATLRRSTGIYEWTGTPSINFGAIINRLSDVKTRYSPKLCQMIAEMLKFDESQRPDFIQLKRWLDGTELMSFRTASFVSLKRGSVGPSMNRSSIGPKLVNGSPILRAIEESEVMIDSSSTRDKTIDGTGKKRNTTEKDDEDEVVEFETEQTPKTSPLVGSQSYLIQVNNNHMPLVFRHKQDNKNAENLKFSLGHQHDPQGFINNGNNGQDSGAPILDFNMGDKGDTNWALSNIFTAMNKNLSSPITASTDAHSKAATVHNKSRHGSLSPERESSPSFLDRSPKRPLKIDVPSKTMPSLKLNLGNLSPLRVCEHNSVDTLQHLTSRNKPVNPLEVLQDSYGTIQELMSPRDTLDLKFYNSPRTSREPLRFDSSTLYPELAGETTQQWRSTVFEGTYNSISSLNSPRSGGNLDLLSQQLRSGNCSLGASPMNTLNNASLKGFTDVCNRVGGFHQSKSSLEGLLGAPSSENTRKSGSFTTRAIFSTAQLATERPSLNKFSDYGFPPPLQSQREPVRKSEKSTTCDPKFLQAEIDQIWKRTSISKNS